MRQGMIGDWLPVQLPQTPGVAVFLRPFLDAAQAQEIAVVFEQFLQACAGYVGEFDFGFLGSTGCLTAFEDVLFAGARGLDHLVVCAVTLLQKALAEPHCAVIHNPGFLEGEKVFVTAMRWDEGVGLWEGTKRTEGTARDCHVLYLLSFSSFWSFD